MEKHRDICILIRTHIHHGFTHVDCDVLSRDGDIPMGTLSDFARPVLVDGLRLSGWVSQLSDHWFHTEVEFSASTVKLAHARRMLKTLMRCDKAIEDASATEHGDVFYAFARAVGAKSVCRIVEGSNMGSAWRDARYTWRTVEAGRNLYRTLVHDAVEEVRASAAKLA